MSITIRTPGDGDFFDWLGLYEGYAQFYEEPLTDQRALQLWSWLTDASHEENALVAVDDGSLVGLVHFREFTRPLEADQGSYIDDLFVKDDARHSGVGRALIDAVSDRARAAGHGVVQWITAADNAEAQALYDDVATRTPWVTYEIDLAK
ncbi:GNAT family N-acetyltransferase [Rathayibacter soli]|uniref:GNAT family N-acetyltransferase n=1 Tax=Rathayibacter soli TaxID=3144168 RepID=UPI0027E4C9DF|nr:GNAT family N-acetyltransferase [Glaciibacter superstes]